MQFIYDLIAFLNGANMGVIFAALFAMSEALALIPFVKSNGVFQAVVEALKSLKNFILKKPAA